MFFERHSEYNITRQSRIGRAITNIQIYLDTYGKKQKDLVMTKALDEYDSTSEYIACTYAKGNLMLDYLRTAIGDQAFSNALTQYYNQSKFDIASPADLITAFDNQTKLDATKWFDNWLSGEVVLWID
jgi:aminopeptidase N